MINDITRSENPFWKSQFPSSSSSYITIESMRDVFDRCSSQPHYGLGTIVVNRETIEAAGPLGQTMIDAYFDRMAKDAARVIFGNLLPPLDAFTAGKYALGNEWPYEKSDDVEQDVQTVWDE